MPLSTPAIQNPQVVVAILSAVSEGATHGEAARRAGLSTRTLDRAIERGRRDPESVYGTFLRAYADALNAYKTRRLAERVWQYEQSKQRLREAEQYLADALGGAGQENEP